MKRLRCVDGAVDQLPLAVKRAQQWFEARTYRELDLPSEGALAARKRAEGVRISVAVPALNEEDTIGNICAMIRERLMDELDLVDELVVIDSGSSDDTIAEASAAGADVIELGDVLRGVPTIPGKGEALWRSLAAVTGDFVVWVDADIRNFGSHFVSRLVAPLLIDPSISFVKGFYSRPLHVDGVEMPSGGGRVTELMARPLLNTFFPELAGFVQPLAGEFSGRREVLLQIPFFTGYGVDVGMLIDLLDLAGLESLAQADLGERIHRNRPLDELTPMAFVVAHAILRRAEDWGRLKSLLDYPSHPLLQPGRDGIGVVRPHDTQRPPLEVIAPAGREPEPTLPFL